MAFGSSFLVGFFSQAPADGHSAKISLGQNDPNDGMETIAAPAPSDYSRGKRGAAMFENAFNNIDRVLRNDEGLASELDYAEQTSWLLFLKYLDDLESERQDNAELEGLRTLQRSGMGRRTAAPRRPQAETHTGRSASTLARSRRRPQRANREDRCQAG